MTQVSRRGNYTSHLYPESVQPTHFEVHTYQPHATHIKWNLTILEIIFMTMMWKSKPKFTIYFVLGFNNIANICTTKYICSYIYIECPIQKVIKFRLINHPVVYKIWNPKPINQLMGKHMYCIELKNNISMNIVGIHDPINYVVLPKLLQLCLQ